jgi:AdoMet-dependent heme synthase
MDASSEVRPVQFPGTPQPWKPARDLSPAAGLDFAAKPFLVIWEVTRACALACVHCRADAIARRDPRELTTAEAYTLIDQVRSFGTPPPVFVLTGGDPMWRKDLPSIVAYASQSGLTVGLTPSGTAAATRTRLEELKSAGLSRIAVSLDGPDSETHDAFRRVRGSYNWTMRIIESAVELGLPLQINSTVSRRTLPTLRAMASRVGEFPLALWAVFFLIQTGRGAALDQITPGECEEALQFLFELSLTAPFGIKTTEAPHYRRIVWEREAAMRAAGTRRPALNRRAQLRAPRSVNDGNGFVFVDHVGAICPSGFLPTTHGNVRDGALVETYRYDSTFRALRDPGALKGKCGRCAFRAVCGGSRSRAFAETGDALASDSLCAYVPGDAIEPVIDAEA